MYRLTATAFALAFALTVTYPSAQSSLLGDRNTPGTVAGERARYGATPSDDELCQILNAVALAHAADGWGLSKKPNGAGCFSRAHGFRVAHDVLHHKPTNRLFDVFVAAGERAEPTWNEVVHHNDPNRPWVAPVGVVTPPPPPPPTSCDYPDVRTDLAICRDTVTTVERVASDLRLERDSLQTQLDGERARSAELQAEVERLRSVEPRVECKSFLGIKYNCKVVR